MEVYRMRPISRQHKLMLKSRVILKRRTTWHCGLTQKRILHVLKRNGKPMTVEEIINKFFERRGPTHGEIWKKTLRLMDKYGPTRGKMLNQIFMALNRLENRRIIERV